MLNNFFEIKGLAWDNSIDICTDEAKTIIGKTAGVVSQIKELPKNCSNSPCILYHQAFTIKRMSMHLKHILDEAVKILHFVKTQLKNNQTNHIGQGSAVFLVSRVKKQKLFFLRAIHFILF